MAALIFTPHRLNHGFADIHPPPHRVLPTHGCADVPSPTARYLRFINGCFRAGEAELAYNKLQARRRMHMHMHMHIRTRACSHVHVSPPMRLRARFATQRD